MVFTCFCLYLFQGPAHTTPEEFKNAVQFHTTPVHTVMKTSLFSKSSVIKTFSVHTKNAKSAFSDSSGG